jgi:sec-independent protein translocase protein TatC
MTLTEHLRELRRRLFISVCAIAVGFVLGWIFYEPLFDLLMDPWETAVARLAEEQGLQAEAVMTGVTSPFVIQAKVALVAALVIASPIWLYQIWAFIVPGLHANERRWTLAFVCVAGPFFLAGVVLGYLVMPKGIEVLLSFTPGEISNLAPVTDYLSFVLRVLIVFGVSFEIPLFVVMLNLAGVVRAKQLARWRAIILFGTFVFAAVATPSTDPITMLLLAIPMCVLFLIAELIARFVDRRRVSDEPDYDELPDDQASPL